MMPIRVLLVENHHLVRRGLRAILDPDPRFEVVGEAPTGAEALRLVREQQPDVVLLDLKLPDGSGVALCQPMFQASPATHIIALTAFLERGLVEACLRAGARGYLLKDAEELRLREQLLTVVAGHTALDPRVADLSIDYLHRLGLSEHVVKGYVQEISPKLEAYSPPRQPSWPQSAAGGEPRCCRAEGECRRAITLKT